MIIKVAKKNRTNYKARFRASSLINFHKELGIANLTNDGILNAPKC